MTKQLRLEWHEDVVEMGLSLVEQGPRHQIPRSQGDSQEGNQGDSQEDSQEESQGDSQGESQGESQGDSEGESQGEEGVLQNHPYPIGQDRKQDRLLVEQGAKKLLVKG